MAGTLTNPNASRNKYEGEVSSQEILEYLTSKLNFSIPNTDISDFKIPDELLAYIKANHITISLDELTDGKVGGDGVFERMMATMSVHLKEEFKNNRISGAEYTTVYTAVITNALQQAVQFELNRYKTLWEGVTGQLQALTASIQLEQAKVALAIAQAQAHQARAQYASTVMQLGNSDKNYGMIEQQIQSYKFRDVYDTGKMFSDAHIALKGINDEISSPNNFDKSNIDAALNNVRNRVGLPSI